MCVKHLKQMMTLRHDVDDSFICPFFQTKMKSMEVGQHCGPQFVGMEVIRPGESLRYIELMQVAPSGGQILN